MEDFDLVVGLTVLGILWFSSLILAFMLGRTMEMYRHYKEK